MQSRQFRAREPLCSFFFFFEYVLFDISGDVAEAVRHARTINRQIKVAQVMDKAELYSYAKQLQVPYDLLLKCAELGRLPVVNFAAGGIGR